MEDNTKKEEVLPPLDIDYPKEFICPITQEVMSDPVVAADGFSYERQAITRWLIQQNTSPTTGAILVSNNLVPNYNLRSLILSYQQRMSERAASGGTPKRKRRTKEKGAQDNKTPTLSPLIPKDSSIPFVLGWYQPSVTGDVPSGRFYAQMAFVSGKLFLWGGVIDPETRFLTDYYVLTKEFGWRRYRNNGPVPYRSAFCMSVSGLELIIFGGFDEDCEECDDVWIMNTQSLEWRSVSTKGTSPGAKVNHTGTVIDNKLYVFGGANDQHETDNELHVLDLVTMTWDKPNTSGIKPPKRVYHSAVAVEKKLFIYGGAPDYKTTTVRDPVLSDLHVLDTETMEWTQPEIKGEKLPPMGSFCMDYVRGHIFFFSGFDGTQCFNNLFVLNVDTMECTKVKATGMTPPSRAGAASCVLHDRIYYFGGFACDGGDYRDVHILDIHSLG